VKSLTVERLREVLDYDPNTGVFGWRCSTAHQIRVGAVAGCHKNNTSGTTYRRIHIDGGNYYAHRLAWLYVHGQWPVGEIDHKDRDGLNNAIANLREATHQQNGRNVCTKRRGRCGMRGVTYRRGKFRAEITVNGKWLCLGTYATPNDAARVRDAAARLWHGPFAVLNFEVSP